MNISSLREAGGTYIPVAAALLERANLTSVRSDQHSL